MKLITSLRNRLAGIGLAIAALTLFSPPAAAGLVLGSKNFTEQHLLSELTTQYLRSKGYEITQKQDLASVIMRNAQEHGQLDLVWEYTGTALIVHHGIQQKMSNEEAYATVKRLDEAKGLVWLNPAALNNTYALAMKRSRAEAEGVRTLSDLARAVNQRNGSDQRWQLGFDMEFAGRPDGLKPLQQLYGMELSRPQIRQMDAGLVYNAIRDGFVDAGLVYTTDGRIIGFDLLVLQDDLGFFPPYAAVPVVRREALERHPGLADELNRLAAVLDNDTMSAMNAEVDIRHRPVKDVAAEFLRSHQLLKEGA
ncbi:glycine/betaine ABC transporter substrate-binding protein [Chromobacterium amazonense]|uniref:Glycine/betaine ABC transporter substrate-binding protein n=1 Tax=Chromobacterium amazonense TaxID=1382803 RepID=A0A2S9X6J8_9NEIS|nr:glycine betaine ABC transporter substrate-binding protein [Chromobacterium amazonense]PRP71307.1 glycine/betaine ABC transporter substrate-binding protein [Chromobacterium amazonense]